MAEEIYPRLDLYSDQSESVELGALLDSKAGERFKELHTEYFPCPENESLIRGWIESRGGCFSLRNLEYALYALRTILVQRPPEIAPPAPKPDGSERGVIRLSTVRVVRDAVTPEDRQQFYDDPQLMSDAERKNQDEVLRRAAIASRVSNRRT